MTTKPDLKSLGQEYQYGFHDSMENYTFQSGRGLTREIVESISSMKKEPEWMRAFRLDALDIFLKKTHADLGELGSPFEDRFRQHPLLHETHGQTKPDLGGSSGGH
jgi:Fe-S cluster assembly protein SufB